jgi:hypothetical protein
LVIAQGTKLYLKVTSWEGGKRSRLLETPHFSFLLSLAASCVGVFLFFEIPKLENWGIKLVEIALGKYKFPNFFVKKGKFCPRKYTAAYCIGSLPRYSAVRFSTVFFFSVL